MQPNPVIWILTGYEPPKGTGSGSTRLLNSILNSSFCHHHHTWNPNPGPCWAAWLRLLDDNIHLIRIWQSRKTGFRPKKCLHNFVSIVLIIEIVEKKNQNISDVRNKSGSEFEKNLDPDQPVCLIPFIIPSSTTIIIPGILIPGPWGRIRKSHGCLIAWFLN